MVEEDRSASGSNQVENVADVEDVADVVDVAYSLFCSKNGYLCLGLQENKDIVEELDKKEEDTWEQQKMKNHKPFALVEV